MRRACARNSKLAAVETIACDLLDRRRGRKHCRKFRNIGLYGRTEFGAQENPALTWAMNVQGPALVAERFRTRASSRSRAVAFIRSSLSTAAARTRRRTVPHLANTPIPASERERIFRILTRKPTPRRTAVPP